MKLQLIKTSLIEDPKIFDDIPHELLDPIEAELIREYKFQCTLTEEPTFKSVAGELLRKSEDKGATRACLTQIASQTILDKAESDVAIFQLRTQAQAKIIRILANEDLDQKSRDKLLDRLSQLRESKSEQWHRPVSALHYHLLQKSEEEEINLHIDWLEQNNVPIKKKVLYSFIATTNGGKTILKTWFAHHLIRAGKNVLYLAQEEPYSDTIRRIYQTTLGMTETQYAEATKDGYETVGKQYASIAKEKGYGDIVVAEWPGIKISDIIKELNIYKKEMGVAIDAVVIDYGKLVEVSNASKNTQEWERIGTIFKELKQMAMTSNVAVVTSIQLNRESSRNLVESGKTADLFDVAGAYEATHHVNYCWSVKLIEADTEQVNFDDPHSRMGTYTLTVQKAKYGNLKKGSYKMFTWNADHSMHEIDIEDIAIPDIY